MPGVARRRSAESGGSPENLRYVDVRRSQHEIGDFRREAPISNRHLVKRFQSAAGRRNDHVDLGCVGRAFRATGAMTSSGRPAQAAKETMKTSATAFFKGFPVSMVLS